MTDSELYNEFVNSNMMVKEFNKKHEISKGRLRRIAMKMGELEKYKSIVELNKKHNKYKNKYAKIDDTIKKSAMADYLVGNLTTDDVAKKYGFNKRRLREWFEQENRLNEFIKIAKNNINGAANNPMPAKSKVMVSGKYNIAYLGRKIETKNGNISRIMINMPNHPDATKEGRIAEHRLVMEQKIGRRLKSNEIVHHVDLDPTNNNPDNLLLVCNSSLHNKLHIYLQYALSMLMDHKNLVSLTNDLYDQIRKENCGDDNTV